VIAVISRGELSGGRTVLRYLKLHVADIGSTRQRLCTLIFAPPHLSYAIRKKPCHTLAGLWAAKTRCIARQDCSQIIIEPLFNLGSDGSKDSNSFTGFVV
jgi:hypothetical protein